MAVRFSTGIHDFRRLRERGYHYVDKSGFIRELLDAGDHVVLLPRPRRFRKSLRILRNLQTRLLR